MRRISPSKRLLRSSNMAESKFHNYATRFRKQSERRRRKSRALFYFAPRQWWWWCLTKSVRTNFSSPTITVCHKNYLLVWKTQWETCYKKGRLKWVFHPPNPIRKMLLLRGGAEESCQKQCEAKRVKLGEWKADRKMLTSKASET